MARQFLWPPLPRAPALDALVPAGKPGRSGALGERGAVQSPTRCHRAQRLHRPGPGAPRRAEWPGTVADV